MVYTNVQTLIHFFNVFVIIIIIIIITIIITIIIIIIIITILFIFSWPNNIQYSIKASVLNNIKHWKKKLINKVNFLKTSE